MTESVLSFSKLHKLNVWAIHLVNVYFTYNVPGMLHPNLPFGVAYTVQSFSCPFD